MNPSATRLLLVEDNPDDARLIQELLKDVADPSFELIHAALLKDALKRISEEPFAAILLDLSLPDGHGVERVKQVIAAAPHTPILVLTGLTDGQVALNAFSFGAQDYITKDSLDGAAIARAVRYAIQRNQFVERIRLLRDIDHAISSTLLLVDLFSAFLERVESVFPSKASCVQRLDKATGLLETLVARNVDAGELVHYRVDSSAILARAGRAARCTIKSFDNDLDPSGLLRGQSWISVLQILLTVNDVPWGLISLFMSGKRELNDDENDILETIISRLAVAVQNAQLYESTVKIAEDLRRSNNVKDEFLSIMSHELRTPLNVMMNCAEILRDGIVGEVTLEQTNILNRLLVQSRNQLGLINGILHVTAMESDKVEASYQDVNLGEFMGDLKADYEISFAKVGVALCWNIPPDLPVIETDGDKVRQILENLINNAIKFTEAGEIRVAVRIDTSPAEIEDGTHQRWIEFEVSDTGAGMAQESLATIFDKFQQLDTTPTRVQGGVGIGLYLVKKFTDLLKGQILVRSELGRGSAFTIIIPSVSVTLASDSAAACA